jgi:hypothetical protein
VWRGHSHPLCGVVVPLNHAKGAGLVASFESGFPPFLPVKRTNSGPADPLGKSREWCSLFARVLSHTPKKHVSVLRLNTAWIKGSRRPMGGMRGSSDTPGWRPRDSTRAERRRHFHGTRRGALRLGGRGATNVPLRQRPDSGQPCRGRWARGICGGRFPLLRLGRDKSEAKSPLGSPTGG